MMILRCGMTVAAVLILCPPIHAQPAASRPAPAQPAASAPAAGYHFKVAQLEGTARSAAIGTDPNLDEGWTPVKLGDRFGPGVQFDVAIRSTLKLVLDPAEPPTVIMLENGTLASIDELVRGSDKDGRGTLVTRLGLGKGAIRAGVAEGTLRSDLEIRSPVATLAKRGTWNFRFYVERGGHFEISLADRGVIEAIESATGKRIVVLPGQHVTQLMLKWIDLARFSRVVDVQDWFGLRGAELVFFLSHQTGLGVVQPGGNPIDILNYMGRQSPELFARQRDINALLRDAVFGVFPGLTGGNVNLGLLLRGQQLFGPRLRTEGDFGVGQGTIPTIPGVTLPLVQKRKAGMLDPRRSASRRGLHR